MDSMTFFDWVLKMLRENWPMFLRGAENTLFIALIGTVIGFGIGILLGVVRTIPIDPSANVFKKFILKFANIIINIYIEVFRGTPMMVQAMVIYYGGASMLQIRIDPISAGLFIVTINTGAYMAEIVRGGIISIDKGQFEAAHAIGMSHWQTMRCVVLPQVIRNILPATGNEFVINIKDTSVLAVISVSELFFQTKSVAGNNFKYFEAFTITCVMYLIMTFTVTRILRVIERKLDGPQNYDMMQSHTPDVKEVQ